MEALYKIIFLFLLVVYTAIRMYYTKDYFKSKKTKARNKFMEKTLTYLVAVGMILFPLIWIFSDFFVAFDINMPLVLRVVGVVISTFSLVFFAYVHKTLGKNWSPILEIREGHNLITSGPYKWIRHPMYTQVWLWAIAQFLIIANWIAGLSGIFTWTILYFLRIPQEEKMMEQQFGQKYVMYKKITGRILPRLKKIRK